MGDKLCGIISKLISGRFIFTVVTSIVFLYATWKAMLNNEQIVAIIMLVIGFYFNKVRTNGKGEVK